jgi:hypothetical protein
MDIKFEFSTILEQQQTQKLTILDKVFNLPANVIVTKLGIMNFNNVLLDKNLEKEIRNYISKYNSLEQHYEALNNID